MIAECEVLMLVSLQSYTLLHFKRKQLLRWNVCQLSEDRNIRNIPSVIKGETHTNRLSFRLNKHKVSYFRLLRFYFRPAHALGERRAWVGVPAWAQSSSRGRAGLSEGDASVQGTAGMVAPIWHWFSRISYRIMESLNHLGRKSPLQSLSPTIPTAMPKPPMSPPGF